MTTTTKTRTVREELASLRLRHAVNELAYKDGRITGPQFIECRTKIRDRMEPLMMLVG